MYSRITYSFGNCSKMIAKDAFLDYRLFSSILQHTANKWKSETLVIVQRPASVFILYPSRPCCAADLAQP